MSKSNYELIMENMTPERMAELGVKLVNVDNRQLFYLTSSGQLFNVNDYQMAVNHEYMWLTYTDEVESKDSNPNDGAENKDVKED